MTAPTQLAVLVSGRGTNLQALLEGLSPTGPAKVARVISSHVGAEALERASGAGIPTSILANSADADEVAAALGDPDLVVLAGYVKRVPSAVVRRFFLRMINIHPALLPAFGGVGMYGARVHESVLASGATISGATVHYVDEEYDHGPVIAQWPVPVRQGDTAASLGARVLAVEHRLLPLVVTALARLGVPRTPVRLFPLGTAFHAGEGIAIAAAE
ncbi:MAG TPA: phosphoribosylglycinamide formyltransferase [Gemmatimonadales bacterium]|nr:phosphoribosylglycinamide formyltransferase [Gemmatimonadales bacterium]